MSFSSTDTKPDDNIVIYDGLQIAPFRTINDFVLDARFGMPQIRDSKRWNNRVVTNLLYFQTNYAVMSLLVFLLISSYKSQEIMLGFSAVALSLAAAFFMLTPHEQIKQLRATHPYIVYAALAFILYYVVAQVNSMVSFIFALVFPLLTVFLHASFRLRDTSAKVNYHMENLKMRNTVMFTVLNAMCLYERK